MGFSTRKANSSPPDPVGIEGQVLQPLGHLLEEMIGGRHTEEVVDLFEVVDIQQHQDREIPFAEHRVQPVAVGEVGQGIGREVAEELARLLLHHRAQVGIHLPQFAVVPRQLALEEDQQGQPADEDDGEIPELPIGGTSRGLLDTAHLDIGPDDVDLPGLGGVRQENTA